MHDEQFSDDGGARDRPGLSPDFPQQQLSCSPTTIEELILNNRDLLYASLALLDARSLARLSVYLQLVLRLFFLVRTHDGGFDIRHVAEKLSQFVVRLSALPYMFHECA